MKIEAGQRRKGLRAGFLLLAVFAVICLPVPAPAAQDCRFCHDEPLYRVDFNKSIHANNGCTSCHVGITNIEKHRDGKEKPAPVDCGSCHQEIAKEYRQQLPLPPGRLPLQRLPSEHPRDQAGQEQKRQARHHREVHRVPRQRRLHGLRPRRGRPEGKPGRGGLLRLPRPSQHPGVPHLAGAVPGRGPRVLHPEVQALPRRQRHDEAKQPLGQNGRLLRGHLPRQGPGTRLPGAGGRLRRLPHQAQHPAEGGPPLEHPPGQSRGKLRALPHGLPRPLPELPGPSRLHGPGQVPRPVWTFLFMSALLIGTLAFFWVHTILWWRKVYWENDRMEREGIVPPSVLATGRGPPAGGALLRQVPDHARAPGALLLHARPDRVPPEVCRHGVGRRRSRASGAARTWRGSSTAGQPSC